MSACTRRSLLCGRQGGAGGVDGSRGWHPASLHTGSNYPFWRAGCRGPTCSVSRRALAASATAASPRRQAARRSRLVACVAGDRGRDQHVQLHATSHATGRQSANPTLARPLCPALPTRLQLPLCLSLHLIRRCTLPQLRCQLLSLAFCVAKPALQLRRLCCCCRHLPLRCLPAYTGRGEAQSRPRRAHQPATQQAAVAASARYMAGPLTYAAQRLPPAEPPAPAECPANRNAPPRLPPGGHVAAGRQAGRRERAPGGRAGVARWATRKGSSAPSMRSHPPLPPSHRPTWLSTRSSLSRCCAAASCAAASRMPTSARLRRPSCARA